MKDEDAFAQLKQYYNNRHYRFEVAPEDFDVVRAFLDEHGYGLVVDILEDSSS
jgi:antitoxin component HigA of HigAB toxin-antitoxin module